MEREYVRDSTRGSAKVIPLNYKGDALVQAWIDARKLATIVRWLDSEDIMTRYISDIVRIVIDVVVDTVLKEGRIDMVEFSSDARDLLIRKFRANLNPSGRGERNMLHNLHLDEYRRKQSRNSISDRDIGTSGRTVEEKVRAETDRMLEKMKEMERDKMFEKREENSAGEYLREIGIIKDEEEVDDSAPAAHLSGETVARNIKAMEEADKAIEEM